jgi:hypothetical protein
LLAIDVHGLNDVRQMEIHTAEPRPSEVEILVDKLKGYKSPSIDEITAGLIRAEFNTL